MIPEWHDRMMRMFEIGQRQTQTDGLARLADDLGVELLDDDIDTQLNEAASETRSLDWRVRE